MQRWAPAMLSSIAPPNALHFRPRTTTYRKINIDLHQKKHSNSKKRQKDESELAGIGVTDRLLRARASRGRLEEDRLNAAAAAVVARAGDGGRVFRVFYIDEDVMMIDGGDDDGDGWCGVDDGYGCDECIA